MSAWVLTDGKAGDENGCLAVTERLGMTAEIRRVRPGAAFAWAMPWGPVDPREAAGRPGSPIRPPFPDLIVASGRRAVPYVRAAKRWSGGRTLTVILKDPRTGAGAADVIWVPGHDRLRGPNVLVTTTAPHRLSAAALAEARARPDRRIAALPPPRAAILVGGDSRHGRVGPSHVASLLGNLAVLAAAGTALVVTTSRRTPPALRDALSGLVGRTGGFLWDGEGQNPYPAMLALADTVVVTAESTNMISEAVATGAPVLVEDWPVGRRQAAFLAELSRYGAVRPFQGPPERFTYEPLDSTPLIAEAVRVRLASHLAGQR